MSGLALKQALNLVAARAETLDEASAPIIVPAVGSLDKAVAIAAQLVRYIGRISQQERGELVTNHYHRCAMAKTIEDHLACGICQDVPTGAIGGE